MRASLLFCGLFTHPEEKASHGSNMGVWEVLGRSQTLPLYCPYLAVILLLFEVATPSVLHRCYYHRRGKEKKYFCGVREAIPPQAPLPLPV